MKAQQLADSLLDDAKQRVQELKRETADEVKKIRQETDEILKQKEEEFRKEVERKEEEEKNRQEASRDREARLAVLECKRALIDDTFVDAATTLKKLTGKKRETLLTKLWKHASSQIDVAHVFAAKLDAKFLRTKTTVKEKTDGIGGFTAVSKDGNISVDFRFETLLEDVKTHKVQEIAHLLFEGYNE